MEVFIFHLSNMRTDAVNFLEYETTMLTLNQQFKITHKESDDAVFCLIKSVFIYT